MNAERAVQQVNDYVVCLLQPISSRTAYSNPGRLFSTHHFYSGETQ